MMLNELIETMVKAIVDNPDQVKASGIDSEHMLAFEIKAAKSDMGKVIRKKGQTIRAMRTILRGWLPKLAAKGLFLRYLIDSAHPCISNGVRLDLDIHPASALKPASWLTDAKISHDPEGMLADVVNQSTADGAAAPDPGDPPEWCSWMIRQIVCWAKRGAQGGSRRFSISVAELPSTNGMTGAARAVVQRKRPLWKKNNAESTRHRSSHTYR